MSCMATVPSLDLVGQAIGQPSRRQMIQIGPRSWGGKASLRPGQIRNQATHCESSFSGQSACAGGHQVSGWLRMALPRRKTDRPSRCLSKSWMSIGDLPTGVTRAEQPNISCVGVQRPLEAQIPGLSTEVDDPPGAVPVDTCPMPRPTRPPRPPQAAPTAPHRRSCNDCYVKLAAPTRAGGERRCGIKAGL